MSGYNSDSHIFFLAKLMSLAFMGIDTFDFSFYIFNSPLESLWSLDFGQTLVYQKCLELYEVSQIGRTKSYLFLRGIYHP